MQTRILAVEDNAVMAKVLGAQLNKAYQATVVMSGEACLAALETDTYDLILLDVILPGLSGYDVCRQLKANPATQDIPVIFLSANFSMKDRLQGFEAGGFDYMVKPMVQAEMFKKIDLLMAHVEETRNLKSSAAFAGSTAMTAMTSAAEQGLVLKFVKRSLVCDNYQSLAVTVAEAINLFGLDSMVQIRGQFGVVSRTNREPCTPLEESILTNMGHGERIIDLKQRTAINYPAVSVIIKNMPLDEPERYGRLKDHLATLLECADIRVKALDRDMQLTEQAKKMINTLGTVSGSLVELGAKARELHAHLGSIFNTLAGELEQVIPLLEINVSQESMLNDVLRRSSAAYVELSEREMDVDRMLTSVLENLKTISRDYVH